MESGLLAAEEIRRRQAIENEQKKELQTGRTEEEADDQDIDFVKEYDTDMLLRTGITVPGEIVSNYIPSFAHARTVYQTIAEADTLPKSQGILASKKA